METLKINTSNSRQVLDVTDHVAKVLVAGGIAEGVCHLFLRHTSAALTVADLDPGTDLDFLDAYEAMAPKLRYRHPHDPAHLPDHLWSATIGVSLCVPFAAGKLLLGEWQRIVLIEFDGPKEREMIVTLTTGR